MSRGQKNREMALKNSKDTQCNVTNNNNILIEALNHDMIISASEDYLEDGTSFSLHDSEFAATSTCNRMDTNSLLEDCEAEYDQSLFVTLENNNTSSESYFDQSRLCVT